MQSPSFIPADVIVPVQVRMARGGLGISVRELARLSGVNKATIVRTEAGLTVRADTLAAIRSALEAAGAEFLVCEASGQVAVAVAA